MHTRGPGARMNPPGAQSLALAGLATLAGPPVLPAQDAPPNYLAAVMGTTVAYPPPGGPFGGFQHDLTALLGYGRFVSRTVALELDLGPTWVRGDYASFALTPGSCGASTPTPTRRHVSSCPWIPS
jgi:hypothetical protein